MKYLKYSWFKTLVDLYIDYGKTSTPVPLHCTFIFYFYYYYIYIYIYLNEIYIYVFRKRLSGSMKAMLLIEFQEI